MPEWVGSWAAILLVCWLLIHWVSIASNQLDRYRYKRRVAKAARKRQRQAARAAIINRIKGWHHHAHLS